MNRTPPTRTLVTFFAGAALTGAVVLVGLGSAASVSTGCSTAELSPAPDAGTAPCDPGPFIFCTEATPDQPGCNASDTTSPLLSKLPRLRYAVGCTVNFVGERDPETNECPLDAVCKCILDENVPAADASVLVVDAGPDAEAGAPIEQPTTSVPRWQCAE